MVNTLARRRINLFTCGLPDLSHFGAVLYLIRIWPGGSGGDAVGS